MLVTIDMYFYTRPGTAFVLKERYDVAYSNAGSMIKQIKAAIRQRKATSVEFVNCPHDVGFEVGMLTAKTRRCISAKVFSSEGNTKRVLIENLTPDHADFLETL